MMNKPLTLLHTEWSDGWGGQERRIFSEMLGMRERGYRVILATRPSCALAGQAAAAGIPVVHVPFKGKFHWPSIRQLAALIRREKVDVVNTHSGQDSWVGALAARLAGVALVRTRHLNLPLHRTWVNFVHFLPDRIVTCGEAMRQKLITEHGFPPTQLVSIPTGIDFSAFAPQRKRTDVRAELGIIDDAYVVLMVAVIRRVKRHEIALRAFAEALPQIPGARLVLCGDGPLRAAMLDLCNKLDIGDSVRFLGHRDDVADIMAAADVLLLTSESEGVPQAVTQGLSLGLPVVATAVGGVPELIADQETGLLVPAENPSAVAAALVRLAKNRSWAKTLGGNGARLAHDNFSLEAMLDATETLYGEVLKMRGKSPR